MSVPSRPTRSFGHGVRAAASPLGASLAVHVGALGACLLLLGRASSAPPAGSTVVAVRPPAPIAAPAAWPDELRETLEPRHTLEPVLEAELVPAIEPAPERVDWIADEPALHPVDALVHPPVPQRPLTLVTEPTSVRPAPVEPADPALAAADAVPGPPDSAPRIRSNAPPLYPRASVRRGHEGSVLLRIGVDARGAFLRAEVLRSSGHELLDEAALEAVRAWTFEPAIRGGVAVADVLEHTVTFRLTGPSS